MNSLPWLKKTSLLQAVLFKEIKELDLLVKDLKEPRGAKMLRARINKMLKTADALLHKLEEERKALGEASADSASEDETTKK